MPLSGTELDSEWMENHVSGEVLGAPRRAVAIVAGIHEPERLDRGLST